MAFGGSLFEIEASRVAGLRAEGCRLKCLPFCVRLYEQLLGGFRSFGLYRSTVSGLAITFSGFGRSYFVEPAPLLQNTR